MFRRRQSRTHREKEVREGDLSVIGLAWSSCTWEATCVVLLNLLLVGKGMKRSNEGEDRDKELIRKFSNRTFAKGELQSKQWEDIQTKVSLVIIIFGLHLIVISRPSKLGSIRISAREGCRYDNPLTRLKLLLTVTIRLTTCKLI